MTIAKQIDNLETLRNAVAAQPESQFDLSHFRNDDNVCGTLFCTVGLACTMPKFQEQGYELVATRRYNGFGYHVEVNGVDIRGADEADEAFGPDAWHNLFTPSADGHRDRAIGYDSGWREYDDNVDANMTDKELALARLDAQIAALKEQA